MELDVTKFINSLEERGASFKIRGEDIEVGGEFSFINKNDIKKIKQYKSEIIEILKKNNELNLLDEITEAQGQLISSYELDSENNKYLIKS